MHLVVGIPTKNEAATIAEVTATVDLGLLQAFPFDRATIINADSASTDRTQEIFSSVPTRAEKLTFQSTIAPNGKGANVLTILEAAKRLGADAVCLIDGDLRSAQPEWLGKLFVAALQRREATFVTPEYTRSRYEANTTNQIVVPYLRAAFGLDVRQPIGGEFAMNAALIDEALTWERWESMYMYGIDVWLTANTALRNLHLESVFVGRKVHNPTFPKIYRLGQEVLDTLFRLMMLHRPALPNVTTADDVIHGLRVDANGSPLADDVVGPVTERASNYLRNNWDSVVFTFPGLVTTPMPAAGQLPWISSELWCELLTDAYLQLDGSRFRAVRDHLVGLFPARVVSYWKEIEHMTAAEADMFLEAQNQRLAELFAKRPLPAQIIDLRDSPALLGDIWTVPEPQKMAGSL